MLADKLLVYENSMEVADIQAGYQAAVNELWTDAQDATAQCFVATATWGLDMWESYLGLKTDDVLSYEVRRERIISKLRGSGVSTKALVERVSESYYNGDAEITEQTASYTFTIKFLSSRGQPPGLAQLQAMIEEIKPAHLAVVYVFLYTTYDELSAYSYDQLAAYTYDELRTLTT